LINDPPLGDRTLELTDEQAETLVRELHSIIQNDRYPSVRVLWH